MRRKTAHCRDGARYTAHVLREIFAIGAISMLLMSIIEERLQARCHVEATGALLDIFRQRDAAADASCRQLMACRPASTVRLRKVTLPFTVHPSTSFIQLMPALLMMLPLLPPEQAYFFTIALPSPTNSPAPPS